MSISISQQGLSPTYEVTVLDENAQIRKVNIAGERPLIIRIDHKEIVTLMTLGTNPEALVLGYLRNQRFIANKDELISIFIDWQTESAEVITKNGIENLSDKVARRIVTTGCGQGTVFSCTMDEIYKTQLPTYKVHQSVIYKLLNNLSRNNKVYKSAGAVHSCALCFGTQPEIFIEDVGRHNAADAIAGLMWLEDIDKTENSIFYTTGRVTSEIVMKVSQMKIPVLLSRSGVTQMGLELAEDLDMIIIARARAKHFLVYTGEQYIIFDNKLINKS